MKISLTISALVASLMLLQGCGSDDNTTPTETPDTTTPIETPDTTTSTETLVKIVNGKTTLSSGTRTESKATVCFDANRNDICDSNEERTETDENGAYTLELANGIKNGDVLIAFGGTSVLPPNEVNTLTFGKVFNSAESSQNINVVSSFVANEIVDGLSYDDAVAKIANQYNLDIETILSNPLDNADNTFGEGKRYVEVISSLEIIIKDKAKGATKTQEKFFDDVLDFVGLGDENSTDSNATDANATDGNETSFLPTLDEVDATITEYAEIFDDFFASLTNFFNDLVGIFSPEDINETAEANLTTLAEAKLTIEELEGTWFFEDASGDKSCVYIAKYNSVGGYNDVSTFTVDENVTTSRLSVAYKDENQTDIKSIELSYGFFSSDEIVITEFNVNHTFTGLYLSDNEVVNAEKTLTLKSCKEDKLGMTTAIN